MIKEDRNDLKLLMDSKAGDYKFIRLKNTKDSYDKDLSNIRGYYVVLKIVSIATWIFLPEKQYFDGGEGHDYGNDYEELLPSTTELNVFIDNTGKYCTYI